MAQRRERVTAGNVEKLGPGDVILDTEEPAFGVRRQGASRVYFVRKHRNGRRHYVTIGAHGAGGLTASLAREKAKRLVAAILDGHSPTEARARERGVPTIEQLAAEWMRTYVEAKLKIATIRQYRSTLATIILPALGRLRTDRVTPDLIERMHHGAGAHPYSANRALAVLSKMLNFAARCGYLPPKSNPAQGIERFREHKRERFLTDAELARLGAALAAPSVRARHSPFALDAIVLLMLTGARLNEILKLRWSEVDADRGLLALSDSKTGKKVIILGEVAQRVLDTVPRTSSPFVFPGARPDLPLESVRRAWRTVCAEAELEGPRLHDLRHTFASIAVAGGASLPIVGKLLGHSQPGTTARYAHLSDDPVRRVADEASARLAKHLPGVGRDDG